MRTLSPATGYLLVVAVGFIGSCTPGGTTDDKSITQAIQAKLYEDSTLRTRDISVISEKGVVVLTGQVSSQDEKFAAEKVAVDSRGVKQVINKLVIVPPPKRVPSQIPAGH